MVGVLSPGNRSHDLLTKRAHYERAGVREYWIVDPVARAVEHLVRANDRFQPIHADRVQVVSEVLSGVSIPPAAIFSGLSAPD